MSELNATLDPDEVMRRMLGTVIRCVPAGRACLLQDHDDAWHLLTSAAGEFTEATDTDIDTLLVNEPRLYTAAAPKSQVAELLGPVRSWLVVPVMTRGRRAGVLLCGSTGDDLADIHLELIAAIAEQGATAHDNARLFSQVQQLATMDGLTGIANRRHFTDLATRQLDIALRNIRPLTAVMVDIDHFKKINDTYGHGTGDEVIKAVAALLQGGIRESDILGRLGGEEFALVLPEMHGDPMEIVDRLRLAIAEATVTGPDRPISCTVSVGVAELKPDDTLDSLLRRADEALYCAKQGGRNQVQAG